MAILAINAIYIFIDSRCGSVMYLHDKGEYICDYLVPYAIFPSLAHSIIVFHLLNTLLLSLVDFVTLSTTRL